MPAMNSLNEPYNALSELATPSDASLTKVCADRPSPAEQELNRASHAEPKRAPPFIALPAGTNIAKLT